MKNRGKGADFERRTCQTLSLWISNGVHDDLLWRSSMSGGRHTCRKKKGRTAYNQAGDICAIHPDGQPLTDLFSIECKFWADLDTHMLFFGRKNKCKIYQFWNQTVTACEGTTRQPLLIVKQNFQPIIALTSKRGYDILKYGGNIRPVLSIPFIEAISFRYVDVLALDFAKISEETKNDNLVTDNMRFTDVRRRIPVKRSTDRGKDTRSN